MDFFDLIKERRSTRAFKKQEVEEGKIKRILEAANSAPSAGNAQSYEIYVVKSKEKKEKLSTAALCQPSVKEAPVVLVFCANMKRGMSKYGARGAEMYCVQDATIACAYAQLAAADLSLGSVWVGAFYEMQVGEVIRADQNSERPIIMLPIGYPVEKPKATTRRKLENLVHKEK